MSFRPFRILFFILFLGSNSFAAQLATVVADDAFIYLSADFDATVIATVRRGEVYLISDKPTGPFYRIRLKDKKIGWISSVDVSPGKIDTLTADKKRKAENKKPLESHALGKKIQKTMGLMSYQGPFVLSLDWKEKTLVHTHKDNLTFYGWSWTGFDTLMEGPFYFDSRVMMSFEAPDYYKKLTSVKATGWVLRAQTSMISANPLGENFLFHYGIGVSTTFSHFETGAIVAGNRVNYIAEDLNLGLTIPIGFSYRIGPIATQLFYHHWIEKKPMSGFSLGITWPLN